MLLICALYNLLHCFNSPLQVIVLCIRLLLLVLDVSLLVASSLVGSCMLLIFLSVPILFCYITCNLHPIAPIRLAYDDLYLVFPSLFSFPSTFFMNDSRNCSMWLDVYMMLSIYAWPLVCPLEILMTEHGERFRSGLIILFSYSIGHFPLISIRCTQMSANKNRQHDAITIDGNYPLYITTK